MNAISLSVDVNVAAGETVIAQLGGISSLVCRTGQVVFFGTARSFIAPDQKQSLEEVFFFGLTRSSPTPPDPVPKSDKFLLIVGHSDQLGRSPPNQELSKRRALAAWAVFVVDPTIWEALYQTENWSSGAAFELATMSASVDIGGDSTLVENYKSNSVDRLDLFERYLIFLRPDWIPRRTPIIRPNIVTSPIPPTLGCGEDRPVIDAPGASKDENRRVEFYFFDIPNPGVRDEDDCPAEVEFRTWQRTCGQFITVFIEIQNEYGDPYIGPFDLTLPTGGVLSGEQTDDSGVWSRSNLPAGLYTLTVQGFEITELPLGSQSNVSLDKRLDAGDSLIFTQVIDLDKWFIPKPNPASAIPQFSRGNIVEFLIDGQDMMNACHRSFISTRTDDRIYITAWGMNEDTPLLGATRGGSEVIPVLIDALSRGADVRALLWDAPLRGNTPEQEEIDDENRRPHRGQAILDNETLNLGSHHQKSAIVSGQNGLVAFCGGIDLTEGRWDTGSHSVPNRNRENHPNNPQPWHDVHTRIRGPAAGDIETNFRERWNNHPDRADNRRTNVPINPIPSSFANGTHLVQTLRTIPPQQRYPFAPTGELSILNAYLKAISNAKDYIYIEDQYLIFDEISTAIGRVLGRLRGKAIIVVPRVPEDPVIPFLCDTPEAMFFHRFQFIDHLLAIDPSKVEVYHLNNATNPAARQNIYVHAKVMIIDDIWATIGSANIGRRSMTHDSELNVAVIDGAIENGRRKFARDLRIELWADHLSVSRSNVNDPIASIGRWASIASARTGQVVVYPRPRGTDCSIWDSSIDPDGR